MRFTAAVFLALFLLPGIAFSADAPTTTKDPLEYWRAKTEARRLEMEKDAPIISQTLPAAAAQVLIAPEKATLFSLDPEVDNGRYTGSDNFHGWKVLGGAVLTGTKAVEAAQEFQQSIDRVKPREWQYQCFEPRHGLQVTSGGHTFDFVLCYECEQIEVYEDNKKISEHNASGSPETLNNILTLAHAPLPRQPPPHHDSAATAPTNFEIVPVPDKKQDKP